MEAKKSLNQDSTHEVLSHFYRCWEVIFSDKLVHKLLPETWKMSIPPEGCNTWVSSRVKLSRQKFSSRPTPKKPKLEMYHGKIYSEASWIFLGWILILSTWHELYHHCIPLTRAIVQSHPVTLHERLVQLFPVARQVVKTTLRNNCLEGWYWWTKFCTLAR